MATDMSPETRTFSLRVGVQGIEPCTSRSQSGRSTDELHPVTFRHPELVSGSLCSQFRSRGKRSLYDTLVLHKKLGN